MRTVVIDRLYEYEDQTFGVMVMDGRPSFVTLEDKWRGNERNVSCIPVGSYACRRWKSPRFGVTYIVGDVPDRSAILFHPGNTQRDTEGCILVGSNFLVGDVSGIGNSSGAFRSFMKNLHGEREFNLIVRGNPCGAGTI